MTSFEEVTLNTNETITQALYAYTCAVSHLLPAYYFLKAANHASLSPVKNSYPTEIKIQTLQSSMFERLLVQLRRLHETNKRQPTLVTNITEYLESDAVINFLFDRSDSHLGKCSFIRHIEQLRQEWKLRDDGTHRKAPTNNQLVSRQNWSVKRAANKLASHITFSNYQVTDTDIQGLVNHSCLIARLIQITMGTTVYPFDYVEVESGAHIAAMETLNVSIASENIVEGVNRFIVENSGLTESGI